MRRLCRGVMIGAVVCALALSSIGCGDDPKSGDGDDKSKAGDTATIDGADDSSGSVDSGKSGSAKDASAAKDTAPVKPKPKPKLSCGETFACYSNCGATTGKCADKCKAQEGDGVGDKLAAIEACRQKECADAKGQLGKVFCAVQALVYHRHRAHPVTALPKHLQHYLVGRLT